MNRDQAVDIARLYLTLVWKRYIPRAEGTVPCSGRLFLRLRRAFFVTGMCLLSAHAGAALGSRGGPSAPSGIAAAHGFWTLLVVLFGHSRGMGVASQALFAPRKIPSRISPRHETQAWDDSIFRIRREGED